MLGFSEKNISLKFRERRIELGLSQADLARNSGLPLRTVQDFESGKREPRFSTLIALGKALNVRPIDLWGGTEKPAAGAVHGQFSAEDVALIFARLQTATPSQKAMILTILFQDPGYLDDFEVPENFASLVSSVVKAR